MAGGFSHGAAPVKSREAQALFRPQAKDAKVIGSLGVLIGFAVICLEFGSLLCAFASFA
jgi:hypothetical protein